jgi:hypothetical protein
MVLLLLQMAVISCNAAVPSCTFSVLVEFMVAMVREENI